MSTKFSELTPTEEMRYEAERLNEGGIMVVYSDGGNRICMETVEGTDPYVWRDNAWRPMAIPQSPVRCR